MTSAAAAAKISGGTWAIDNVHSLVEFATWHNTIAYVKGRFRTFNGTINVNEQDLLKSTIEVNIDATSVESQAVQGREDLINGADMLDTATYPQITFKSKNIQQKGANEFVVTGDLTMRGVTRETQIPLTFNGIVTTRMGVTAGFSSNMNLKLSDFGVPFTREFEPGKRVVDDVLKVELQIEARPQS
ncbi:MAG: YceI family protein [Chloroflexi bacterium]|nr:YceI family protein [Chloroflexota bacterium]MBV9598712.1 YceI family protein [Chloroflexota bacterium]